MTSWYLRCALKFMKHTQKHSNTSGYYKKVESYTITMTSLILWRHQLRILALSWEIVILQSNIENSNNVYLRRSAVGVSNDKMGPTSNMWIHTWMWRGDVWNSQLRVLIFQFCHVSYYVNTGYAKYYNLSVMKYLWNIHIRG